MTEKCDIITRSSDRNKRRRDGTEEGREATDWWVTISRECSPIISGRVADSNWTLRRWVGSAIVIAEKKKCLITHTPQDTGCTHTRFVAIPDTLSIIGRKPERFAPLNRTTQATRNFTIQSARSRCLADYDDVGLYIYVCWFIHLGPDIRDETIKFTFPTRKFVYDHSRRVMLPWPSICELLCWVGTVGWNWLLYIWRIALINVFIQAFSADCFLFSLHK